MTAVSPAGVTRTGLAVALTRAELAAAQLARAGVGGSGGVGLVMTMGALHEGHTSLIRTAQANHSTVVVTVFVNPLQFAPSEDFASYPRHLGADLELASAAGADIVFAPPAAEVYRGPPDVTVHPGPLGDDLEGVVRPGHFAGVLTVVHKFLHIVSDVERAYFGEKDYQQLLLIRRMAHDLDLRPEIAGVPTVREPGGLARSSRNRLLAPADRSAAVALPDALFAGAATAAARASPAEVLAAAAAVLNAAPALSVDYLQLRSPDLAGPPAGPGTARLLAAVRVGRTRLIDNVPVEMSAGG
ncbi:MAG: pantoate--beta-alanine ligase [Actinomycetota bacterium]|nr:pantoate--beta-alanine ligase [Actinomycetota bacterium]